MKTKSYDSTLMSILKNISICKYIKSYISHLALNRSVCSSFMYAGDLQEGDPKCLEVVLKLGTRVPHQLVEPFTEGERPHKDDIIAWKTWQDERKSKEVFKVVRVTKEKPNILGGYHIQYGDDEKTNAPLYALYKILTKKPNSRVKSRL